MSKNWNLKVWTKEELEKAKARRCVHCGNGNCLRAIMCQEDHKKCRCQECVIEEREE